MKKMIKKLTIVLAITIAVYLILSYPTYRSYVSGEENLVFPDLIMVGISAISACSGNIIVKKYFNS
jgi:hypothetical protein